MLTFNLVLVVSMLGTNLALLVFLGSSLAGRVVAAGLRSLRLSLGRFPPVSLTAARTATGAGV